MNPILDNVRNEAKTQLLTEFKPYLDNFDNTTRFIKTDYQKFRNQTENDLRDLYSMNQGDDDYSDVDYQEVFNKSKPKITIIDDDAGNFGASKGSDNFISLDNKDEQKENLLTGDIHNNENYDEILADIGNFFDEGLPVNYNEEKELPVNNKVNDGAQPEQPQINFKELPVNNKVNDGAQPEQPQINFKELPEKIEQSKDFYQYMNSKIKLSEAKQLYKDLGGNDPIIKNAGGPGSINKVRGGISNLLKTVYNYHNKATTKDAQYNQWNRPENK
jgi:hypothetical protein